MAQRGTNQSPMSRQDWHQGSPHFQSEQYRNSLVAIDNETGEVAGIVASNVTMSAEQGKTHVAHTPSEYTYRNAETAATSYIDRDVKPTGRPESIKSGKGADAKRQPPASTSRPPSLAPSMASVYDTAKTSRSCLSEADPVAADRREQSERGSIKGAFPPSPQRASQGQQGAQSLQASARAPLQPIQTNNLPSKAGALGPASTAPSTPMSNAAMPDRPGNAFTSTPQPQSSPNTTSKSPMGKVGAPAHTEKALKGSSQPQSNAADPAKIPGTPARTSDAISSSPQPQYTPDTFAKSPKSDQEMSASKSNTFTRSPQLKSPAAAPASRTRAPDLQSKVERQAPARQPARADSVPAASTTIITEAQSTPRRPKSIHEPSEFVFRNAETAATSYRDSNQKSRSRANSILGEDTFAPPPTAPKPRQAQEQAKSVPRSPSVQSSAASISSRSTAQCSNLGDDENSASDGRVGIHAQHAESHRPDLLRDTSVTEVPGTDSILGASLEKLWDKARGGEKGAAKRQARKEAKRAQKNAEKASEASTATVQDLESQQKGENKPEKDADAAKDLSQAADGEKKSEKATKGKKASKKNVEPPRLKDEEKESPDEKDKPGKSNVDKDAKTTSLFNTSPATSEEKSGVASQSPSKERNASQMRAEEDRVWRDAIESGSLPVDGAYTHLAVQSHQREEDTRISDALAANATPRNPILPLQGNSVLIDFLSGSRIVASVVQGATAPFTHASAAQVREQQTQSADPRSNSEGNALIPAPYLPLVPAHLLWYFGLQTSKDSESAGALTDTSRSLAGADLMRLVPSADAIKESALRGAAAVGTLAKIGLGVGLWLGSSLAHLAGLGSSTSAAADKDADKQKGAATKDLDGIDSDGEWEVPPYDPKSLAGTPRPVYRRKKPVPSVSAGVYLRQRSEAGGEAASEQRPGHNLDGSASETQRYSIIHVDEHGVGRRALMRSTHEGSTTS